MKRYLLVLSFLSIAVVSSGCRKPEPVSQAATEAPAVRVKTISVQPQSFPLTVAVTGTLVSRTAVEVKAETTGRVMKFPKEEGDRVSEGEPILWVDQANHLLALKQAEAAVKVAEASRERAQVLEGHSRSELERAHNLLKSGGITDRDLKAAQLAEKDAAAQTVLAEAQLAQAKSALDTAGKRVRDAIVRAPVAGEIQRKMVNAGAYVEPATAVFTLVNNGRLELESQVAASDLAPVRGGQRVTFATSSFPGETFEGRVVEISPAIDAEARSAKVRVRVDNARGKLRAGMFAQGSIETGVQAQAILVPSQAAYRDDRSVKDSYVFVVEDGKARRRAVRIGHERDALLEIVSGLKPGEAVIAEQSIEIADGVRVQAR